ncbi:MAG: outer membrane protein assembly factor BamE [Gammaproteobacteria bacterium]|nr:outer membrane protein assembly factor BamE [Gammaproteobacteria bacterium]MDD9851033.1 outer membrane protein assembly factor BamE [Gammaproteobacteria bacterium]
MKHFSKLAGQTAQVLIATLALVILSGCAATGTKLTEQQIAQLEIGKTTYDQAIEILGEPTDVDLDSDGNRILVYEHTKAKAKGVNFIPVVGLFAGGTNTERDITKLYFGKDGVLKDMISRLGIKGDIKTGVTAQ